MKYTLLLLLVLLSVTTYAQCTLKAVPYSGKYNGWTLTSGKLKNICSGPNGSQWGVNTSDFIFYRSNPLGSWKNVSGRLSNISCSSDGSVWGTSKSN